jgi:hypothetical protein
MWIEIIEMNRIAIMVRIAYIYISMLWSGLVYIIGKYTVGKYLSCNMVETDLFAIEWSV